MNFDLSRIEIISDGMAEVLRQKTGAERLEIASRMFDSARSMLTQHLRSEHPDWSDQRVKLEVARRLSHGSV